MTVTNKRAMILPVAGFSFPLPGWTRAVLRFLPPTRGIASARQIIVGASLAKVIPLLAGELLVGLVYILLGYGLFRWFEFQAKRRGALEAM